MGNPMVETRGDFLRFLDVDVSMYIMSFLDDPADLVRACAVSRFWHQFVVSNGLAKKLCLKRFPELYNIIVIQRSPREQGIIRCNNLSYRDDHVYASLLQVLTNSKISPNCCIATALSASSTNSFPYECVVHSVNPCHESMRRNLCWSSKGQSDPQVPETLVYKLRAGICVITEIDIKPFEATLQPGKPIYSSKSVRFRFGYLKSQNQIDTRLIYLKPVDDKIEWTYTSPEFPMSQEANLQPFVLPEPVLCIGEYLQIELIGRVQRQEVDGLFYIRMFHVQALGWTLFPVFNIEILEPHGKFLLKYYPESLNAVPKSGCRRKKSHLLSQQLDETLLRTEKRIKVGGPNNSSFSFGR